MGVAINLKGVNTIYAVESGIKVNKSIRITGDGTLNISPKENGNLGYGINLKSYENVTLMNNVKVNVHANYYAICGAKTSNAVQVYGKGGAALKASVNETTAVATIGQITSLFLDEGTYITAPVYADFSPSLYGIAVGEALTKKEVIISKGKATYPLSIAGIPVTSDNASAITGSGITGSVKYNHDTQTLTLENANINAQEEFGIEFNGAAGANLTIHLKGNNLIKSDFVGLAAAKSTFLCIEGTGKAEFIGELFNGIDCSFLTLQDGCEVSAYGQEIGVQGSKTAYLRVINSTLRAKGVTSSSLCLFESLILRDCEITEPANAEYGKAENYEGNMNAIINSTTKHFISNEWVKISPTGTGLSTLFAESIYVWGERGAISINTPYPLKGESGANVAHIYNVSGMLVRTLPLQRTKEQVAVPSGIYIVRIGTAIEKVVVR